MTGYYYGNPHPTKAKLQGVEYVLPKGFRAYTCQTPSLEGEQIVMDNRGRECNFRIINSQPCLISMGGVWDIYPDTESMQTIGGTMYTTQ